MANVTGEEWIISTLVAKRDLFAMLPHVLCLAWLQGALRLVADCSQGLPGILAAQSWSFHAFIQVSNR